MTISKDAGFWDQEFASIDLGDQRLNSRLIKTAKSLSSQPTASINQSCGSWSQSKAAYRLFDNEKFEAEKVLLAHGESARARMENEKIVLVIQDTSFLNYTEHFKTTGLGRIGSLNKSSFKEEPKGLIAHTALAVTTQGSPIGILDQNIWIRDPAAPLSRRLLNRKRITVEHKESRKWLKSLDRSLRNIPDHVQAVTVCDRESDAFEFIAHAEAVDAKYLIRSSSNRSIRTSQGEVQYLRDHMKQAPITGHYEVAVVGRRVKKQKVSPNRAATLALSHSCVELRRPPERKVDRTECHAFIKTYVVWAREVDPPLGEEALDWMLLTNVAVENPKSAKEKVDWYKQRWHIESFHKTLKSGCSVESCRLQSKEKLARFTTLMSLVAWRLYWITNLHREKPDESCTTVLQDHEWQALYSVTHQTAQLPKKPPTIREATRWIAQLGGFLARKNDGEPGIITVWRGWQQLSTLAKQWLILHPT